MTIFSNRGPGLYVVRHHLLGRRVFGATRVRGNACSGRRAFGATCVRGNARSGRHAFGAPNTTERKNYLIFANIVQNQLPRQEFGVEFCQEFNGNGFKRNNYLILANIVQNQLPRQEFGVEFCQEFNGNGFKRNNCLFLQISSKINFKDKNLG